MKKILSIACLALLMLTTKAYAQSNVTWTIKDNIQKGFFKSATTINSHFSGFSNKEEATKFYAKIKSNPEVASAEATNGDAFGNCEMKLTMKKPHDKKYYIMLAQRLGVAYINANGQQKTPAQLLEQIRTKNK